MMNRVNELQVPKAPGRRYDIDWLRVFATYTLFLFHGAMVFNPAPFYHIRNADLSIGMLIFAGFISLWHMPLFFVLAGWSVFSSLKARGGGGFLKERILRLAIPLVAGCLLFGPPIKYLELKSGLDANYRGLHVSAEQQESFKSVIPSGLPVAVPFDETFLRFLPTFFTKLERFSWSHLWFLAYLFTFTILYIPLFLWLMKSKRAFEPKRSFWIYLPIVPLALIQIILRPHWPGLQTLYKDWANFAYYSTFLFLGFLMARFPAFEQALHREWKRALGISLGAMIVLLFSALKVITSQHLILASTAVAGWGFVVALLGFSHARLQHTSPRLDYLTESAYQIYILHQPAIIIIGYAVIQLPIGIIPKFVLLLAASVTASLAVYQFIIKPIPLFRFAFGMKLQARRVEMINNKDRIAPF